MIFLLLLLSFTAFAEKVINIELKNPKASSIKARLTIPNEKLPFQIVLYLHGSNCKDDGYQYALPPKLKEKNYALLKIQKPGAEDCFSDTYLLGNSVFSRVEEAQYVLNFIKKKTQWTGEYFLIGASEGTVVASLLGSKRPPRGMVLLAGANGFTMEDELMKLVEKGMKPCGFDKKEDLKKKIELIYTKADSKETWCSSSANPLSYYWWSRILRLSVMDELLHFDFPILVLHGLEDDSVPIESSVEVEKVFERKGKKNLKLKRFEGLNHQFRDKEGKSHIDEVISEVTQWLEQF